MLCFISNNFVAERRMFTLLYYNKSYFEGKLFLQGNQNRAFLLSVAKLQTIICFPATRVVLKKSKFTGKTEYRVR